MATHIHTERDTAFSIYHTVRLGQTDNSLASVLCFQIMDGYRHSNEAMIVVVVLVVIVTVARIIVASDGGIKKCDENQDRPEQNLLTCCFPPTSVRAPAESEKEMMVGSAKWKPDEDRSGVVTKSTQPVATHRNSTERNGTEGNPPPWR